MKQTIILFIVTICSLASKGQNYLGESRSSIKKIIPAYYDSSYQITISETIIRIDTFYTSNDDFDHLDTLINMHVLLERKGLEKIKIDYFFNRNNFQYCDSIVSIRRTPYCNIGNPLLIFPR